MTTEATRYTAEPVAGEEPTFRRVVAQNVTLSGDAADLFEAAIENGSVRATSRDRDEARADALDRVLAAARMSGKSGVLWSTEEATAIVRYEGSYYRLGLTGRGGAP